MTGHKHVLQDNYDDIEGKPVAVSFSQRIPAGDRWRFLWSRPDADTIKWHILLPPVSLETIRFEQRE